MDAVNSFIHLHTHSAYSLAEGAIKVPDLLAQCAANKMPAIALTDTSNLFGALEFSSLAFKMGIKPIIGCRVHIRRDDAGLSMYANTKPVKPDTLVLLCQNEEGYQNILQIVSDSFLETAANEAPQVSYDDIRKRAAGLIALTAGAEGTVSRLLLNEQISEAEIAVKKLSEIFENRLYIEIERYGETNESYLETKLIDLAYKVDIPLVATNGIYFSNPDMYEAHDALLCMADKTFVSVQDRRRLTPEHYFKSTEQMRKLFQDLPEAISNTRVIFERCSVMSEPREPILPKPSLNSHKISEEDSLRVTTLAGLKNRLHQRTTAIKNKTLPMSDINEDAYFERLEYELKVIIDMGFAEYFMIVADFIGWSKEQGIPVGPGRGSGAGSLVAWSLLITDLDPIRYGLLFERFLNPDRISMPDFDIDFCQERREEVIKYVQQKYGEDRVAQIITFGKLQARAAVRNTGRVLEMPLGYVDRICKMIPNDPAKPVSLSDAIKHEPELRDISSKDENVRHLLDIALKLEGLYNHAATHAAGVVIADRPLAELVPLYRDPSAPMPVTQFSMKWAEAAGLVKFDFLGLKTLTVIDRTVKMLAELDINIQIANIPLDDSITFSMLQSSDTIGVFQLESAGMRDLLRKLKPTTFEDIIAVVALFRPGPMENLPSFISRKHGQEEIVYMHPVLEPILRETYGIMIYQEQVMQSAQAIAGYSPGAADLLRRAMGKKIPSEMNAQRAKFIQGAAKSGIAPSEADDFFENISDFAGYGFNKSHAAAYGLIAYQTAYLKANYPVEFMAATMTLDLGKIEKLAFFKSEVKRAGINLYPPDINCSHTDFTVEIRSDGTKGIRYSMAAIKNVGVGAVKSIVAARDSDGNFSDVNNFIERMNGSLLNKRLLENLIKAGCFDTLHSNRNELFSSCDLILREIELVEQKRRSQQSSFLEERGIKIKSVPDWRSVEKLTNEFDAIGFYLSAHPLDPYSSALQSQGIISAAELPSLAKTTSERPIRMAGTMVSKKEKRSKSGNRFAFVVFSDATGTYEAIMFSEVLASSRNLLESGKPFIVNLEASMMDQELKLNVNQILPLVDALAPKIDNLCIRVKDGVLLDELRDAIKADGVGNGRIMFLVVSGERQIEIELEDRYAIRAETLDKIKDIPGVEEIKQF